MSANSFHLTIEAARKYQAHSVPAMFAPLARATMERVTLPEDAHIIDIACGTGALTREIAMALTGRGRVAGTDLNDTMIEVARASEPEVEHEMQWQAADVCNLPFDDAGFDIGFIQQGLQFFPDKPAALAEIARVLKPGGTLYLTCWRAISPFNDALATALSRHVSEEAATKARAPFSFRDGELITRLLRNAGFDIAEHDSIVLQRRFADLREQVLALPVEKDMRAMGADVVEVVLEDVATLLAPYDKAGVFVVPQEAHFFAARKV